MEHRYHIPEVRLVIRDDKDVRFRKMPEVLSAFNTKAIENRQTWMRDSAKQSYQQLLEQAIPSKTISIE